MRNRASSAKRKLTLGNGQLGNVVQQAHRSAQELALEVIGARARHLQPPSALGRRTTDGDVPPAVEVLIVYGGAEAAKSQGCDENESHCAYFTKVYAGLAKFARQRPNSVRVCRNCRTLARVMIPSRWLPLTTGS